MANDCDGTLRVVTKNKAVLGRVLRILEYEDDEFCLYRCRGTDIAGEAYQEPGGYWVQDFYVCGAWSCSQFFNYGDRPSKKLIIDYAKNEDGKTDYRKPIEGSAHFTDLCHLAKVLDFGCELFASEPGAEFCQHCRVNHSGEFFMEEASYKVTYHETGEDITYDGEYEEDFGGMDFMEFAPEWEIYGDVAQKQQKENQ